MPTYSYECDAGHEFEVVQKITDEPITRCKVTPPPTRAVCSKPCRRVIQAAAFHLKGRGWAADRYQK